MNICHHPGEDTLFRYASGTLDRAAATVIATHVAFCRACQGATALAEATGGALLAALPPAGMAPGALDQAMMRLDAPELDAPKNAAGPPPPRMLAEGLPVPATLDGLPARDWRWVAPGVRRISLLQPGAQHGRLYLLRIDPGVQVPQHGHEAWEATCVLAGSFQDELGVFGPGDLVEVDSGHHHRPVATGATPCICLVAAGGRMRFASRVARLLQPLVGV